MARAGPGEAAVAAAAGEGRNRGGEVVLGGKIWISLRGAGEEGPREAVGGDCGARWGLQAGGTGGRRRHSRAGLAVQSEVPCPT